MWSDKKKDSGQAGMTRKGEAGFWQFLTGGDRLNQNDKKRKDSGQAGMTEKKKDYSDS